MNDNLAAVTISLVSLLVAGLSLGWNIYRDVVLKPRLRVRFQISTIVAIGRPGSPTPTYLNLSAVNHGPGKVMVSMIHVRTAPVWRRILRQVKHGVIVGDWTNPLSGKLPATLEIGQKLELLLPYEKECFLDSKVTQVGINDSFGRSHWAPRRQLNEARRQYKKDFGADPAKSKADA